MTPISFKECWPENRQRAEEGFDFFMLFIRIWRKEYQLIAGYVLSIFKSNQG